MFSQVLIIILALFLFLSNRAKDEKRKATSGIQEASSHEDATSIRSKTKEHLERRIKVSIALSIICVFVFLIGGMIVSYTIHTSVKEMAGQAPENDYVATFVLLLLVLVVMAAVVLYNKGYYDFLTGHIQTVTYEDFIQQNRESPFVLYLRSFNEDFYTEKKGVKKTDEGRLF